ncbi:MAG TPA: DUF4040 domain-containing protein, partial [Chloroflexaceae bacterium]|nr:DUF4040 domain-containing protein [Chloroflexaceae bacterium]
LGAGVKAHAHEAPAGMLAGPALLTLLSVVLPLGLLPATERFLMPAVQAIAGEGAAISLYLIPSEIGVPLILSLGALLIGAALTYFEPRIVAAPSPLPTWLKGDVIYDAAIDGMLRGATSFTRRVQNGKLRTYITWAVCALIAVVAPPLALYGFNGLTLPTLAGVAPFEFVVALLIPMGAFATVTARSRLGAIIASSVVGAMVALFFVIYSAPDLALTQLLVETLLTVFLLLVFAVLPVRFERLSSPPARMRDGLIAGALGLTIAGIAFAASSSAQFPSISQAFRAQSQPLGFGDNVVNVILVDFRAFDTLGEIVVLFAALLGIYAMLRLRPASEPRLSDDRPAPPRDQAVPAPAVLAPAGRLLAPEEAAAAGDDR